MAYLKTESGADAGRRYELDGDEITIGRYADCEIVLKEAGRVSRYHARITRRNDRFFVNDMGSRNGTFVNDVQIGEQLRPLADGDRVRVCDVVFVFRQDALPTKRPNAKTLDMGDTTDAQEKTSPGVILVEEGVEDSSSTIMSKVDVTASSAGTAQLSATAVARLAALLEITRNLGRALALDEVLPQVLNSLFKIFLQADRGFIVLQTEDGKLIPRWTKARKGGEDAIRISRTIVRHVMESKEAVLSEDATSDWTDVSQSIADLRIRSMMCAPLLDSEGNALGVIQLDTLDQRKHFQQGDLEVLASVAVQAGIAIDNAQLHDRALQQKELEQDLALAREVQKAFLPRTAPPLPAYQVVSYYLPAKHVGGDYYDYIAMPDGRMAIIVADVVGHGVAAAMMMAKVSAEAKYCLASESHPASAMSKLNDRITTLQIDRFVTVIMIVLDTLKHEVTIVNAGHMAPIWHHCDGAVSEPGSDLAGLPVGIIEGFAFDQATICLTPGDVLVMYTDGLNEAMNPQGKLYTIPRLRDKVAQKYEDLEALRQAVIADVREFIGDGTQEDDMCFVCLQRMG